MMLVGTSKRRRQVRNQRQRLRRAQGDLCAGCATRFLKDSVLGPRDPRYPTFDHVIPRSRGGRRSLDNFLLKHRRCNEIRGNAPPTGCDLVWLAAVRARVTAD